MNPVTKQGSLMPGDWAEVRSMTEIQLTLDAEGKLAGLPFMPEMADCCGRVYPVLRRVYQTCVEGFKMQSFQHDDVILLDGLRCSGSAHDGCQKGCTIFWKEAWLKRAGARAGLRWGLEVSQPALMNSVPRELPVRRGDGYICQSTELARATHPISIGNRLAGLIGNVRSGSHSMPILLRSLTFPFWLRFRKMVGVDGNLRGPHTRTPEVVLELKAGDLVEVKSEREIALTLDRYGRNRGLEFTPLMKRYCGGQFRVLHRVERMILETTGKMRELHNTVILRGSSCEGWVRLGGCPRDLHHLWREIWLTRIGVEAVLQELPTIAKPADEEALPCRRRPCSGDSVTTA
jgi:hypothetical protein